MERNSGRSSRRCGASLLGVLSRFKGTNTGRESIKDITKHKGHGITKKPLAHDSDEASHAEQ